MTQLVGRALAEEMLNAGPETQIACTSSAQRLGEASIRQFCGNCRQFCGYGKIRMTTPDESWVSAEIPD
jgi:hypothetical protein